MTDFNLATHFALCRPCGNCPFLKIGAIELSPGRLDGIIEHLLDDDHHTFHCHKTVHNRRTGGEWDEDGEYHASGQESMCAGATIYLEKIGQPNVAMRIGRVLRKYDHAALAPAYDAVIDPPNDEG